MAGMDTMVHPRRGMVVAMPWEIRESSKYAGRCYFYNNESQKSEWCLPKAEFESSVRPSSDNPPQANPSEELPRRHATGRSSPSRNKGEVERHGRRASPGVSSDRGVDSMKANSQDRAQSRGRRSADSSGSDAYHRSVSRSRTESPMGVAAAFREASKKRSESSHRSSRGHSLRRQKQSYPWDENSPPNVASESHGQRHREERPPPEQQQQQQRYSPSRMMTRNDMVADMPPVSRRIGDSYMEPTQRSMEAPYPPTEWRPPTEPPARATHRAEWLPAEAHRQHEAPWRHVYHEGYVAPSAEDIMFARQRNGAPPGGVPPGGALEPSWQLRPQAEPAEFRGRYQSASVERGRSWGRPESSYGAQPGHDYQRPPSMVDEYRSSSRQRSQSQPRPPSLLDEYRASTLAPFRGGLDRASASSFCFVPGEPSFPKLGPRTTPDNSQFMEPALQEQPRSVPSPKSEHSESRNRQSVSSNRPSLFGSLHAPQPSSLDYEEEEKRRRVQALEEEEAAKRQAVLDLDRELQELQKRKKLEEEKLKRQEEELRARSLSASRSSESYASVVLQKERLRERKLEQESARERDIQEMQEKLEELKQMEVLAQQSHHGRGRIHEPTIQEEREERQPSRGRDTKVRELGGGTKGRRASEKFTSAPVKPTANDQDNLDHIAAALLELKYGALRVYRFMNKKKAKMVTKEDVALGLCELTGVDITGSALATIMAKLNPKHENHGKVTLQMMQDNFRALVPPPPMDPEEAQMAVTGWKPKAAKAAKKGKEEKKSAPAAVSASLAAEVAVKSEAPSKWRKESKYGKRTSVSASRATSEPPTKSKSRSPSKKPLVDQDDGDDDDSFPVLSLAEVGVGDPGDEDEQWLPALILENAKGSNHFKVRMLVGYTPDDAIFDVDKSFVRKIPERDTSSGSSTLAAVDRTGVAVGLEVKVWYALGAEFSNAVVKAVTDVGTVLVVYVDWELEEEVPVQYMSVPRRAPAKPKMPPKGDLKAREARPEYREGTVVETLRNAPSPTNGTEEWQPAWVTGQVDKNNFSLLLISSRTTVDAHWTSVRSLVVAPGGGSASLSAGDVVGGTVCSVWRARDGAFQQAVVDGASDYDTAVVSYLYVDGQEEVPLRYVRAKASSAITSRSNHSEFQAIQTLQMSRGPPSSRFKEFMALRAARTASANERPPCLRIRSEGEDDEEVAAAEKTRVDHRTLLASKGVVGSKSTAFSAKSAPATVQPVQKPQSKSESTDANVNLNAMPTEEAAAYIWEHLRAYMHDSKGGTRALDLFREIDKDKSGKIDVDEFVAALNHIGMPGVTTRVAKAAIKTIDPNGDGELEYKEIAPMLKEPRKRAPTKSDTLQGAISKKTPEKPATSVAAASQPAQKAQSSPLKSGSSDNVNLSAMPTNEAAEYIWEHLRAYMHDSKGGTRALDLFREIDKDKSGKINADELIVALEHIGVPNVSMKVAKAVIHTIDPNGDGELEYKEIAPMLKEPRKKNATTPPQSRNASVEDTTSRRAGTPTRSTRTHSAGRPPHEDLPLGEELAKLKITPTEVYEHANQFGAKFVTTSQIERTLQFLIKRSVTSQELAQVMVILDPKSAFKTSMGKVDLKHFKAKFPKLYKIGVDTNKNKDGLGDVASVALAALAAQKSEMATASSADVINDDNKPFAIGDVVEVGVGDTDDEVLWLPAEIEAAADTSGEGFFSVRMMQGYDEADCRFDTDPMFIRRIPRSLGGVAVPPSSMQVGLQAMVWYAQGQECYSAAVQEVKPHGCASCVVNYSDFHGLTEEVPFAYLRDLNATAPVPVPAAHLSATSALAVKSPKEVDEDEEERVEDLWDHFEEDTDLNPPRKDPKKWQALQDPGSNFHDKTTSLVVRSGLGASRRRHLWPLWSGGRAMASRHPVGTYEKLSGQPANKSEAADVAMIIVKDVARTFASSDYFKLGDGKAVLSRLLLAFQRLAPDPGYVQGMATLAAVVLLTFHGGGKAGSLAEKDDDDDDGRNNVSIVLGKKKQNDNREIAPDRRPMPTPQDEERDAFWTFAALVTVKFKGYFEEGMPSLRSDSVILHQLVHRNAPAMATVLENSGFEWNMLAPQWFLQVYTNAVPSKATLHLWDLVLWTAHASDLSVGPGAAAAAAAAATSDKELPHLHPARCVLLWAAVRIVALARASMRAGEEDTAAKGMSALTLEAVLKSLKESAATAGNLLELTEGMPEFEEIASKAQAIAAQRAELERIDDAVKSTKEANGDIVEVSKEKDLEVKEGDEEMGDVEEEEEVDQDEYDGGSSGGENGEEETSGLADLEALADESGTLEEQHNDDDEEQVEDDAEDEASDADELLELLTEFGLASLHGVLASAAQGKSAQHLVGLGQKQVVALGIPFIKARKLLAKAEAMAAAPATIATSSGRKAVNPPDVLPPARESKAHDLTSALLPETPVEKQKGSNSSSTQPSSLLSPETPEKGSAQPSTRAPAASVAPAPPAAAAAPVEEEAAEVDELAMLLEEFGVGSLYGVLASAAKGTSAPLLLALGQKGAVALGLPFIKARKLWAKAESMAAASTNPSGKASTTAAKVGAGAADLHEASTEEGSVPSPKSKWKLAASEAVEMHRSDKAAAAEMSALIGLSSSAAAAAPSKTNKEKKKHFSDVVLDAFEANALDSAMGDGDDDDEYSLLHGGGASHSTAATGQSTSRDQDIGGQSLEMNTSTAKDREHGQAENAEVVAEEDVDEEEVVEEQNEVEVRNEELVEEEGEREEELYDDEEAEFAFYGQGTCVEVSVTYEGESEEVWLPAMVEYAPESNSNPADEHGSLYVLRLLADPNEDQQEMDVHVDFLRPVSRDLPGGEEEAGLHVVEKESVEVGMAAQCWYAHEHAFFACEVAEVNHEAGVAVVQFVDFDFEQEVPIEYLRADDGQGVGESGQLEESEIGYSVRDDDDEETGEEEEEEGEEAGEAKEEDLNLDEGVSASLLEEEEEAQRRADLEEQGLMCHFVMSHLPGAIKELRARGLLKGAGRGGPANEVSTSALVKALQTASSDGRGGGCPHDPLNLASLICSACGYAVDGPEEELWNARIDTKGLKEQVEICVSEVEALLEEEEVEEEEEEVKNA